MVLFFIIIPFIIECIKLNLFFIDAKKGSRAPRKLKC